jgi:putative sterol carrier protein
MTTIATEAPRASLDVTLADGEENANILAKLLKQHVDAIVAADPAKATVARRINGKLGLYSTEPDARVTLVFDGKALAIKNGFDDDLDASITGPLKLQTETLTGQANPYVAMLKRKLKVGFVDRPLFSLVTYR